MSRRDPYEVLGVSREASADEIKSAYRRLAPRYHPDVNPDDPTAEEKFKEVGAAYSVIGDPEKRARFDRFGTTDDQPSDPFYGGNVGNITDLFDIFFGGGGMAGGRRSHVRHGDDLRYDLEVTLLDVLNGAEREIEFDRLAECNACNGVGTEGGTPRETCETCRGQGVVSSVRNTFLGQVRTQSPCPTCHGEGSLIKNPCKTCRGQTLIPETAKVPLHIPPGFEDGASMHVPGQGNDGIGGGRPGDLYVVLHVKQDERFRRQGQTLYTKLNLTFAQASLGDSLTIDGLDAPVEIDVPAGTQPGTQIAVRGQGLPPLHGGRRGDLVLLTQVVVPTNLSEAQVKLIRELAEVSGEEAPKGETKGGLLGGLFGKKK